MPHLIYHAGSAGKATKNSVGGMLRHTQRKKMNSHNHKNKDIDTSRTKFNMDFMKKAHNQKNMSAYDVLEERMENEYQGKRKLRKDQVVLREVITQPSPEFFEGMSIEQKREHMKKFVLDAMPWFNGEFGSDNVLGASAHLDETNPHAHFMIMPMTDDGRISQTEFFTGPQALRNQHKGFREHMIQKGWDFELENKYEDIDNHELPVFKANAEKIQKDRASQTAEVREMSQNTDVRQEAVNLALQDVHENVLKEEREKLEAERERLRKMDADIRARSDAHEAQSRTLNDDLMDLHNRKADFIQSFSDITRGFIGTKTSEGLDDMAKVGRLPDSSSTFRDVLKSAVGYAIRTGQAEKMQEQAKNIAVRQNEE